MFQRWKDFFSNYGETSEKHHIEGLKTHYYKDRKNTIIREVENLAHHKGLTIVKKDEARGELFLRGKNEEITVQIVEITPVQVAVDFTFLSPKRYGYASKSIIEMYSYLDNSLHFIGRGLGQ